MRTADEVEVMFAQESLHDVRAFATTALFPLSNQMFKIKGRV